jgi:putative flippase GtrA
MIAAFGGVVFATNLPHLKIPWQFIRFCVVGSTNAVIDFGVLNLLLWWHPTTNNLVVLEYNSLAVILASTNSFLLNKYWTFQAHNPINMKEVSRFVVLASGTTLMNDGLILVLSLLLPGVMNSSLVGANVLKLGAIIGTMSISFFGMQLWVFIQKQRRGEEKEKPLADYRPIKMRAVFYIDDHDTQVTPIIRTLSMCSPEGR